MTSTTIFPRRRGNNLRPNMRYIVGGRHKKINPLKHGEEWQGGRRSIIKTLLRRCHIGHLLFPDFQLLSGFARMIYGTSFPLTVRGIHYVRQPLGIYLVRIQLCINVSISRVTHYFAQTCWKHISMPVMLLACIKIKDTNKLNLGMKNNSKILTNRNPLSTPVMK